MARTASSPILQLIRRVCEGPRVKDSPDQELLRRFLGGRDEAAFEALLRRHGPMVLDVCRGVLGNEADAEDAFQATFLVLARKAESVRKAASLGSWLHGVAYRTALRARADAARRQKHEARAPGRCTTTDPDELTWREVRQAVHEELARLPARHRAALVLCYLEGKTQDEAAAQLGLAKGTLKGHLERGRALLRARLVRRGLAPAAALVLGAWPAATRAAGLSLPRLVATVKAAAAVAAGGAAASVVSPNVAALSEGMVKAMFFKRLKIVAILFVAIAGSGAGLALAMREPPRADSGGAAEQPAPPERPGPGADAGAKEGADMGRPIRSLSGHKERVISVAYAPDGRWVATAAWDGTARLWDAQTGEEVRRLDVPPSKWQNPAHLSRVLFSPDNELVVAARQAAPDEAGVIVWDRRSGEKVREFPGGYGSVAVSPDGSLIACGGWGRGADVNSGVVRLYELATGKPVRELHGHQSRIEMLAFSPDGETVIALVGIPRPPLEGGLERGGFDPSGVRAWDVATGKERRSAPNGLWSGQLATSPDGRTVAAGILLRETATGGERVKLTGHTNDVCAVAFSPDGRTVASGSMDGTVRLWDLPSGKEVARFGEEVPKFAGRGWVLAVAFSPDGRTLVSGGLDKTAQLWDVSRITGRRREPVERSAADLEADWKDLAGDAAAGYAALGRLVSSPGRAVAFLGKQLQGAEPVDTRRIARLIADLDAEQYPAREQATRELEALAERAAPALRKALAGDPSPEARRRLEALLDRLDGARPSAETVREVRAVEALELIGTPEARRLLDQLAAGPAEAPLTQEAKAAAGRLARRAAAAP
jgi:RNA polymerase sigma factor (sigma-70 family)